MRYSLEELVSTSGLPVDTIRYYQTRGLLQPPERQGRRAVYDATHLDRLHLIRVFSKRGLSLKLIGMLLRRGEPLDPDQVLLAAIEEERSEPSYSVEDLASRLGIPRALLASIEATGLTEGLEQEDGSTRYTDGDLRVARGALKLMEYGFPLTRLLALAIRHDRTVRRTIDGAIDMFNEYVRKRGAGNEEDPDAVAGAFKDLLPVVTALVAHHFQRVLVSRALKRLRKSGDESALRVALRVASKTRLGVRWQ